MDLWGGAAMLLGFAVFFWYTCFAIMADCCVGLVWLSWMGVDLGHSVLIEALTIQDIMVFRRKLQTTYGRDTRNNMYYIAYLYRHCDKFRVLCTVFEKEIVYVSAVAKWITIYMRRMCLKRFKRQTMLKFRDNWWAQQQQPKHRHATRQRNGIMEMQQSSSSSSSSETKAASIPPFDFWSFFIHYMHNMDNTVLVDHSKPYESIQNITNHADANSGSNHGGGFQCPCNLSYQVSPENFKIRLITNIANAYDTSLRKNIVLRMRTRVLRFLNEFYVPPSESELWPQNYDNTLDVLFSVIGGAATTEYRRHLKFLMETFADALPPNIGDGSRLFANLRTDWLSYIPFLLKLRHVFHVNGLATFNIFPTYPDFNTLYRVAVPVAAHTLHRSDLINYYHQHC